MTKEEIPRDLSVKQQPLNACRLNIRFDLLSWRGELTVHRVAYELALYAQESRPDAISETRIRRHTFAIGISTSAKQFVPSLMGMRVT